LLRTPPSRRSGTPHQFLGVLLHTVAMSGLSRVRTELFHLLVVPFLAQHPVQTDRQSPGQGDLGDLPPRRIIRWKYWLRHSGRLRAVTWAASTSKKRSIELPCFVICPRRRRLPLDSSSGTNPR